MVTAPITASSTRAGQEATCSSPSTGMMRGPDQDGPGRDSWAVHDGQRGDADQAVVGHIGQVVGEVAARDLPEEQEEEEGHCSPACLSHREPTGQPAHAHHDRRRG